jgi:hypothetical protein
MNPIRMIRLRLVTTLVGRTAFAELVATKSEMFRTEKQATTSTTRMIVAAQVRQATVNSFVALRMIAVRRNSVSDVSLPR